MLFIPAYKLDPFVWLISDLKWSIIGQINNMIHEHCVDGKDYEYLTIIKQEVYDLTKPDFSKFQ